MVLKGEEKREYQRKYMRKVREKLRLEVGFVRPKDETVRPVYEVDADGNPIYDE